MDQGVRVRIEGFAYKVLGWGVALRWAFGVVGC